MCNKQTAAFQHLMEKGADIEAKDEVRGQLFLRLFGRSHPSRSQAL
jgi:hypothetical protein